MFVEGSLDRELLAFASTSMSSKRTFYEIDTVDVPRDALAKHHLTNGSKQRIIALARELDSVPHEALVLCLADRDLDHWFGPLEDARRLRWTTYCSIENHFLTVAVISDILIATGRARIASIGDFSLSLLSALRELYCLRLADRETALALKWIAPRRYLGRKGDVVTFDVAKYTIAVLSKNSKIGRRLEFEASYAKWSRMLDCDQRLAARGHDYTDLLAWAMQAFDGEKSFRTSVAIERLFVLLARSSPTLLQELDNGA